MPARRIQQIKENDRMRQRILESGRHIFLGSLYTRTSSVDPVEGTQEGGTSGLQKTIKGSDFPPCLIRVQKREKKRKRIGFVPLPSSARKTGHFPRMAAEEAEKAHQAKSKPRSYSWGCNHPPHESRRISIRAKVDILPKKCSRCGMQAL
jgi:hypothetical protein